MNETPAVLLKDVRKRFNGVDALGGLSFSAGRGCITALLGPNGAGKTTAIRLLLSLVRPDSGYLEVLGMNTAENSLEIRRRVGYVPEKRSFTPGFTVERILGLFRGLSAAWDAKLAKKLIADFSLPLKRKARDLSKGMTGQLSLVLAMAPRPEVLILDEPVSGLDPVMRRQFLQTVLAEVADRGQSVLLSSHDLSEVERIADTIVLMKRGRAILSGPMDIIKSSEKKVRIVPQGELPAEITEHGSVVSVNREGNAFLVTVSGDIEGFLQTVRRHGPLAVDVLDQSLEDIFLSRSQGGES
jgi:ABC-2 type transport system ATP-binding protein